jgi:CTP synthase
MSGRVLRKVIDDERAGAYLGKTVQIVPHVTGAIQEEIRATAEGYDVHIVEIGGTVGDYEGLSFIEAIRELALRVGRDNCAFVHVVYVPYLGASKEFKTKPAQAATRELRGLGIVPDVLAVRSEAAAPASIVPKLAAFCGVDPQGIALLPNAHSVYEVPLTLEDAGIGEFLVKRLGLKAKKANLKNWRQLNDRIKNGLAKNVHVGIVAKYLDNEDTYMSVVDALRAAAWDKKASLKISWIDATKLESSKSVAKELAKYDGVVVPGGFGVRGFEGKVLTAQAAIKSNQPYLGLCLGLQAAVVGVARNAGMESANSTEFDHDTTHPVISLMDEQHGKENTGGTMRLGDYDCVLTPKTISQKVYGSKVIVERHRHRYEFNNTYRETLTAEGLVISGQSPDGQLVEMIEMADHPFFVATQAHPEFKSRPNRPHPLFSGFIEAILRSKA